jgi:multiple sugar transport system substrate-binding protein
MTDLLKKYNFDTSRIIPSYMQDLQAYGDKGQIWGLPMSPSLYGTLYNKDLFDKFGVPYPRDDMTWEETLELAKRVTRQDGGVQYRGLDMTGLAQLYTEKKLNPIPAGDKAVVSTAPWQNLAKVWKSIYEIPGNEKRASGSIANFYDPFLKGQLAMLSLSAISIVTRSQPYPDLKWDLVTFPTFKETPKTAPYANFKMIGISSTSKHKDEAFAVIASLFSDETQLTWAQSAVYATVLNNPQIQTAFAANIPTAKGKNMAAFYKHELSHLIYNKYFTGDVSKALTEGFDSILNDGVDINTALREAEENMNKAIAAAKAAQ